MFFSSGYLLYCFLKSLTDLREVSSLLSLGIFFFFARKFIFNSKKIILWPYSHQHFWILSLDLSKFNWIKINTVTNSSWIVSKISFLSWIASLLDSYFLNWNIWKKIMRSYTGNRTEYLLAWIPLNSGNFTSLYGSVLHCLHIQKSS